MRRRAKSFALAGAFLPASKRRSLEALYAVFRVADDLADEPGLSERERREGLLSIARDFESVRDPSYDSRAIWFLAVRSAFLHYPIAIEDALGVVAACSDELAGVHPRSIEDLERHAASLSGGVARCGVAVIGSADEQALALAQRVGIAMQLTNILRDAERDRAGGRDYFAFANRNDIGLAANTFKHEIARRAHAHFAAGVELAASLPRDGSDVAILLAVELHRALLERMERGGFVAHGPRVRLGAIEMLGCALRAKIASFRQARRVPGPSPRSARTPHRRSPRNPESSFPESSRP